MTFKQLKDLMEYSNIPEDVEILFLGEEYPAGEVITKIGYFPELHCIEIPLNKNYSDYLKQLAVNMGT